MSMSAELSVVLRFKTPKTSSFTKFFLVARQQVTNSADDDSANALVSGLLNSRKISVCSKLLLTSPAAAY